MVSPPPAEPDVIELAVPTGPGPRTPWREAIFWMLAAAVLLFIGILKGINLVIVMAYLLAGLWVVNFLLARRAVSGIAARRLPRPPVVAGAPTEWNVEIHDDGSRKGAWTLHERIDEATAAWLVVRTGAPATFRPRIRATIPRRGRYTLEPMVARSTYPFGLASRAKQLLPGEELIVLPRPARVDGERLRAWLFRAWAGRDEERRKLRRVVEREAEVHGLRDYRAGDSPRRVHWKATARRGKLTVREYEDSAPPRVLLIVDPWLPKKPSEADRANLEAVISLAAGVCREWRRAAGARLALAVAGPTPWSLDGPPGPALTEQLLVGLALESGGVTGDVAAALGGLTRGAKAAPALVLSSRVDSPMPEAVSKVLGRKAAFVPIGPPAEWYQFT